LLVLLFLLLFGLDTNQAQTLLQKGLVALQHGQLADARSILEEASRADPQNPYVWTSLAETYVRTGEPAKAEAAAAKAEQIAGKNPVVVHALTLFSFKYAQQLLRKQDFTHAADVLSRALQNDPRDSQLLLALGVARYGQRRFDEAITLFLRVIQIDRSIEQPYVFIGKVLDQAGPHLPEITKDYEAWNTQQPTNPKAPLVLAKALLISDPHSQRAADLLRHSIELDPNQWESHYELGVLLAANHDYKNAAAELERSIELDARQAMPHYHLARVYDRLGQPDKAKREREIHQNLIAGGPR
jgi:tetratricopeptide (TPR) repeat protein